MDTATFIALCLGLLAGVALGAGAGWLTAGVLARGREAVVSTERDLLARRVAELELATSGERELASTLSPLTQTLERVEQQVRTLERDRVEQYARLDAHLDAVRAGSDALRAQTAALAGALRSPTARGAWGEVQLRRVVELAGMVAKVDYTPQAGGMTPEGVGVRPDMVVHLPGGKHVVVDAKAPLAAFLEASEAANDADRQSAAATAHARALRGHVDVLSAKEYWTAFQPAPEVVVCFVPGEAFLAAACTADPSLLEHAMSRRVVLATPTTLLALLRTVALSWQGDALTGNAKQLLEIGRELHSRLGALGERTGKLGKALQRAVDDYNSMVGTLERRVLVTARKIRDMELVDTDPLVVEPLESTVRSLTAPELRLELADDVPGGRGDGAVTHDDLCLPVPGDGKALAG